LLQVVWVQLPGTGELVAVAGLGSKEVPQRCWPFDRSWRCAGNRAKFLLSLNALVLWQELSVRLAQGDHLVQHPYAMCVGILYLQFSLGYLQFSSDFLQLLIILLLLLF
jgi:hypothetical protein